MAKGKSRKRRRVYLKCADMCSFWRKKLRPWVVAGRVEVTYERLQEALGWPGHAETVAHQLAWRLPPTKAKRVLVSQRVSSIIRQQMLELGYGIRWVLPDWPNFDNLAKSKLHAYERELAEALLAYLSKRFDLKPAP